jgi:perosamine synthetase
MTFYPVTEPVLDGTDRAHLLDAFDSGWISSQGPYLTRFEDELATLVGTNHALATCNGTAALHVALLALGCGPGDEVILPTFTYVATANAVRYTGATPVLVDCDPDTWNLAPAAVLAAITPRTVGIIAVHLYGAPCDMDKVLHLADRYGLWTVEDAAEAHGATVGDRLVGSLADIGTFSLYGNKIITTGEGGAVTTDDPELARLMSLYRGQGMDPERRYWFPVVGYNYRMTNLAAALGVAQLAKIERLVAAHRRIDGWYREELAECDEIAWQHELPGTRSVSWLTSVRYRPAENRPSLRDDLMARLAADGIDSRPFFYPMHILPAYEQAGDFPCADAVSSSGLNLPSSPMLTRDDVAFIAGRVRSHVETANLFNGVRPIPRRQLPQPSLVTA